MRLCQCGATAQKGRTRCPGCRRAAQRAANPILTAYNQIKDRARRRGIQFALPWEFFSALSESTGYVTGRGRSVDDLHIDRIDSTRGYVPDNVRVVTAAENLAKSVSERGRVMQPWEDAWDEARARHSESYWDADPDAIF
jgi:hypothetical protein